MSTKSNKSVPKYRHHKPSGQAVVTLDGHDHLSDPPDLDGSGKAATPPDAAAASPIFRLCSVGF
jgi:hypothetical protein